jgi:nucleoid-associated protein YgaU
MRKDLKTGMLFGASVVIAAIVAMSVWPGQSVESRLRQSRTIGGDETIVEPASAGKQHLEPPPAEPAPVEEYTIAVEQPDAGDAVQIEAVARTELPMVEEEREVEIHVVVGGETLSSISLLYYGSSSQWRRIVDANPKVITDENRLQPGMRLVIPR